MASNHQHVDESCKDDKSEKGEPKTEYRGTTDQELDDLLDSVIDQFDKPINLKHKDAPKSLGGGDMSKAAVAEGASAPSEGGAANPAEEELWSEEFLRSAQSEIENVMKEMLRGDPAAMDEFKTFAEKAAKATNSDVTTDSDFETNLSQTLKGLADNAEAINSTISEESLAKMFSGMAGLGLDGGSGEDGGGGGASELSELLPFMTNMMQTLLCKEMLYPALHEIADKYPDWLADNRSKIAADEYERLNRQYELMRRVCRLFEEETETDSDETKKKRFENILELMQQMQQCGQPPKELIGDLAEGTPGVELDSDGNLKLPSLGGGSGGQCPVM